jgi:hypothetical protein
MDSMTRPLARRGAQGLMPLFLSASGDAASV